MLLLCWKHQGAAGLKGLPGELLLPGRCPGGGSIHVPVNEPIKMIPIYLLLFAHFQTGKSAGAGPNDGNSPRHMAGSRIWPCRFSVLTT